MYNVKFAMYNGNMGKAVPNAFTLVELLVAIAITAIVGVFALSNYRLFGEDQNLKSAVLDIQSLLRTAQTNASSNLSCDGQYGATWQIQIANATTINLNCQVLGGAIVGSPTPVKQLILTEDTPNISVQSIAPTGIGCTESTSPFPTVVSFAPLNGKISFEGNLGLNCTKVKELTITLSNNKTSRTKSLKIDLGGKIYAP